MMLDDVSRSLESDKLEEKQELSEYVTKANHPAKTQGKKTANKNFKKVGITCI